MLQALLRSRLRLSSAGSALRMGGAGAPHGCCQAAGVGRVGYSIASGLAPKRRCRELARTGEAASANAGLNTWARPSRDRRRGGGSPGLSRVETRPPLGCDAPPMPRAFPVRVGPGLGPRGVMVGEGDPRAQQGVGTPHPGDHGALAVGGIGAGAGRGIRAGRQP